MDTNQTESDQPSEMSESQAYEHRATRQLTRDDSLEEEVCYHYEKKFSFQRPPGGWQLPAPELVFRSKIWEIPEMLGFKDELNAMKDKLNDFNLDKWHKHTRITNPSSSIVWKLRQAVKPELLTLAWCKMYEMLSTFPIIPQMAVENSFLNSLHLCEAPGAFVSALNHYLKLNHPEIKWDWICNSLNPHYEENALSIMIDDDRFMVLTLDRWKFGADYTGNITSLDNFKALVTESVKLGPILLITADGSIDCQDKPADQEETVAPLHYCEVVSALHILSAGGSLIVKMFTMYEHSSICLMYFLNACFEYVHVHKPVCSKEGNSENYVICINYDGTDERKPWLRVLREHYSGEYPNASMFPLLKIPESFIDQLLKCTELFKAYQTEVLERNVRLFLIEQPSSMARIKRLKYRVADVFFEKCKLIPLAASDEIIGESRLENVLQLQQNNRVQDGTFNERRQREQLPPLEKLELLRGDINKIKAAWSGDQMRWLKFPQRSLHFSTVEGRPVKTVRSSKFCQGYLIHLKTQCSAILEEIGMGMCSRWVGVSSELSETIEDALARTCPEVFKEEHRILNFKNVLWSSLDSGRNEEFERKAFLAIFDVLDSVWRDVNIIIQGYPMITQFTAGVVYMLGHLFEQVGFLQPQGSETALVLRTFRSRDPSMASFMDRLVGEAEHLLSRGGEKTVLSLIPISEIIENSKFYETVFTVNMLTIREQLLNVIDAVLPGTGT